MCVNPAPLLIFLNPNSQSSLPGLNSSDPSARDYWSSVAAIVSATLFRGARPHSNSPDSDILPVLDPHRSRRDAFGD